MFKLSAEDIAHQSFETCFRGYDPDQVEEFLRVVAREWKHMRSELERVREEAADREEELEEYRDREESLHEALETAKQVADDIREKAEREAELKIADAEVEADRILSDVEQEVESLQADIERLRQQRKKYRAELRSLLNSHLEMLDRMEDPPSRESISRSPSVGPADVAEADASDPEDADDGAEPEREEASDEGSETSEPADRSAEFESATPQ